VAGSSAKKNHRFAPFDLSQLDHVEATTDHGMDRVDDLLAKSIAKKLFYFLGTPVEIKKHNVTNQSLSKIEPSLDQNKCLVFFKLKPWNHRVILAIDTDLAERLLSLACGDDLSVTQKLTPVKPQDLEDASIASSILKNVIAKILESIESSWKKYYPIEELAVTSFHILEKYAHHDIPDLQVRKLELEVLLADQDRFIMSLLVPTRLVESLSAALINEKKQEKINDPSSSGPSVGAVEVEVRAVLGEVSLSIEEILNLQAGDVIELGGSSDDPVDILINSKKKFKATVGIVNGKRAIKIC
jgi:flagellar motor switch protein FliM